MTMLEGLCPRGAKIFGAISLTPVVPAVCLGSLGPLQRRVRVLATMTTHHCFAKLSANLRFEFEILIWSTLLIWKATPVRCKDVNNLWSLKMRNWPIIILSSTVKNS